MPLTKPVKLLVGALSLWPFVYMVIFFLFVATSMFWMASTEGTRAGHHSGPPAAFMVLAAAHFATILLMFGLIAFYVIFLFKTDRVPNDKKALWAVVLFLGNMLAMPVFFYLYIWPDQWPRVPKAATPA